MDKSNDPAVVNTQTGKAWTLAEVAEMREELERDTGLDLTSMSPRGIVLNYIVRKKGEQ